MNKSIPVYIVITADMIQSRDADMNIKAELPGRLQKIDKALDTVLPSEIYAGDEIQILLKASEAAHPWLVFYQCVKLLFPMKFRFGFGIGHVDFPLRNQLAQNNGDAFILARKALETADSGNILAVFQSRQIFPDRELNTMGELFSYITLKWTDKHWRRFFLYEEMRTIHKVAQIEMISPEAVNKMIHNAGFRQLISSLDQYQNRSDQINQKG